MPSPSGAGKEGKERESEYAEVRQLGLAQTRGLGVLMQPLVGRSSLPDRRMYRYVTLGVLRSLPEPLRAAASRHSRLGGQQNMYTPMCAESAALALFSLEGGGRMRLSAVPSALRGGARSWELGRRWDGSGGC